MIKIFSPSPLPAAIYCFSTTSLAGRRARTPGRPRACAAPSSLPPPLLPPLPPQPGSFAPGPPRFPPAPGPAGFAALPCCIPPIPGRHRGQPPGPARPGGVFLLTDSKTYLFGDIWGIFNFPRSAFFVVKHVVCKYRGNSTTEHFVVVLLSIKNTFCFSNKPHNQAF